MTLSRNFKALPPKKVKKIAMFKTHKKNFIIWQNKYLKTLNFLNSSFKCFDHNFYAINIMKIILILD